MNLKSDLMMDLDDKFTKANTIHPKGNLCVCQLTDAFCSYTQNKPAHT